MANRALSVDHKNRGTEIGGCLIWVFGLGFLTVGSLAFYFLTIRPLYGYYQARSWTETPCLITSSKVGEHVDDGTTYSIDVTYDYEVAGRKYSGDVYSPFHRGSSSSGFESKKAVVDALPKGTKTVCFVDPDTPAESVLVRSFSWVALWGFFPLPFLAIGVGTTGYLIHEKLRGPREDVGSMGSDEADLPLPVVSEGTPDAVFVDDGPISLEATTSPTGQFVGALLGATLWNGILMFFVWAIVDSFLAGDIDWFKTIFIIPFVLVGVCLIYALIRSTIALTNPRPLLSLSRSVVPRGECARVSWAFDRSASSIQRLKICIVNEEAATYTVGTDTKTDTETIYEDVLFEAQGMQMMETGEVELEIPTNLMHSFEAENNKIQWAIEVHGDIRRRPDIKVRFPFKVI